MKHEPVELEGLSEENFQEQEEAWNSINHRNKNMTDSSVYRKINMMKKNKHMGK